MQFAAKLLTILAFLAGAFLTSLDPKHVNWVTFVPVILAGVLGVIIAKRLASAEAHSDDVLTANRAELTNSLNRIVTNLEALDGQKDKVPTYEMRFEIDRLFRDDLMRFADARESLKHMYGLRAYADIMSSFAAGERYLNRVWSASTDGYIDEVLAYVEKSLVQFKDARAQLSIAASH
ncbi:hypothetical protein [Kordiimonas pumila]|uniref:DUF4760 domain-containing protein n=1 Tax=Kordiimonas pumila TaxID=2161677 RepID=A0ABV7D127_9PROT|nr:hypothetical protein [Kordiimonas pumila]